jgi:hypothetical protein
MREKGTAMTLHHLDTLEQPAFELCEALCCQYEFTTEPWREKSKILIDALISYFFGYDEDFACELIEMHSDAVDDAKLGRGEAEVENLHRDTLARRRAEHRG